MAAPVKAEDITHHYLFSAMDETSLSIMTQSSRRLRLEPEQHLFRQDDPADAFYLVLCGQIKLTRLTPDGNEKVIELIAAGQTFAEAIMFMDRRNYPVTATAITQTELISLPMRIFTSLLQEHPDTCMRLLGDLAMRLRNRLQEIEHLTMKNATYRVVRFFLTELERNPQTDNSMELSIQKQLIASRLSIQPETLSRIFQTLREQGILDTQGRTILIKDVQALREFE